MPFVTWNPLSLSPRLSLSRARYEFVNPRNYPYFVLVFLFRFTEVENADSMSIWLCTQRIIEMSAFVDFVCNLPVDILSRVHRLGATNSLRLSRLSGPYSTVWGFVQRCKKGTDGDYGKRYENWLSVWGRVSSSRFARNRGAYSKQALKGIIRLMAKSTEKDQVYTFFSPAPCPGCMSIQAKRSTRLRSCYADPFKSIRTFSTPI